MSTDLCKIGSEDLIAEVERRGLEGRWMILPSEMETQALQEELFRRGIQGFDTDALERIYEEFRDRGDAPEVLRDFLYETIGRILP